MISFFFSIYTQLNYKEEVEKRKKWRTHCYVLSTLIDSGVNNYSINDASLFIFIKFHRVINLCADLDLYIEMRMNK